MGSAFAERSVQMIAVIISEVAGWLKNEFRLTISAMVIVFSLVGSFTFMRPEYDLGGY